MINKYKHKYTSWMITYTGLLSILTILVSTCKIVYISSEIYNKIPIGQLNIFMQGIINNCRWWEWPWIVSSTNLIPRKYIYMSIGIFSLPPVAYFSYLFYKSRAKKTIEILSTRKVS